VTREEAQAKAEGEVLEQARNLQKRGRQLSLDVAEVVERFTVMDQRMLTVKRIHRCLTWLWLPVVGVGVMSIGLLCYASGWAVFAWLPLGGAVCYVLCWTGEELASTAMQLLELNLEECKAIGTKEGE
jgi:hypothetical protein